MKSKISFFNKAIFKKNLTLYWPIWGVYTLTLLCMHPVVLWLNMYYDSQFYNSYTLTDKLRDLISCLNTEPDILLIAVASIVIGMSLYGYLYNHKSANMIHSLPVDRNQLFGTNVISGMTFLIVPLLLTAVVMTIVAACNGLPGIENIWIWFLLMAGTAFSAFSIVTFCAMFTGHVAALPVYVLILNCLPFWAYYMVYAVIITFGYGVDSIRMGIYNVLQYFSPLACFLSNVGLGQKYDDSGNLTDVAVYGGWVVAIYVLVSIVLLAIAYFTYKKRQVEKTGDFLTVEWLKPVFRWGVGMTGGVFGALAVREVLISARVGCGMMAFVLIMLALGAICYFAADMLICKTFRVFKKKNWIGCGGFSVILLLCFFGLYSASQSFESYVPEVEDVSSASISMRYEVVLEEEEAQAIIDIHEQLLEYNDYCQEYEENGNWDYDYINITYNLKDGDYISRYYIIPYKYEEMDAVVSQITELEQDDDNLLSYLFCQNYDKITEFGTGWFTALFLDYKASGVEYSDYTYVDFDLTTEQVKELYEAVIADAKAGTLTKYNTYATFFDDYYGYSEAYINLEFKNPNIDNETYGEYYDEYYDGYYYVDSMYYEEEVYSYWGYACIYIGPDCENIINKLIEFGLIESVDEVYWGKY